MQITGESRSTAINWNIAHRQGFKGIFSMEQCIAPFGLAHWQFWHPQSDLLAILQSDSESEIITDDW